MFAGCRHYSQVLPPSGTKDAAILDMCSSWVSHYPKGYKLGRISGRSLALYRLFQPAPEHISSSSGVRCMLFMWNVYLLVILHMSFRLFACVLSTVGQICLPGWTSPQRCIDTRHVSLLDVKWNRFSFQEIGGTEGQSTDQSKHTS